MHFIAALLGMSIDMKGNNLILDIGNVQNSMCVHAQILYRGVPLRVAEDHVDGLRACGSSSMRRLHWTLPRRTQRMMEVTCSPPMVPKWINATAREKAKQLDEVVLAALLFASNAASPAFNIDDHYRLAGAISAALEAAPEVLSADTLEVGSFQGHTALFTASVASQIIDGAGFTPAPSGPRRSMQVHAVEMRDWPHLRWNLEDGFVIRNWTRANRFAVKVLLHQNSSRVVGRQWERPLRMFFEDSAHDYDITKQSFDAFEPYVIEGGLVLLHDVGCCAATYPEMMRFLREWRQNHTEDYTEVELPPAPPYQTLPDQQQIRLLAALARSLDFRSEITDLHVRALLDALPRLETLMNAPQEGGTQRTYRVVKLMSDVLEHLSWRSHKSAPPPLAFGDQPLVVKKLVSAIERLPRKGAFAPLGSDPWNCSHVCKGSPHERPFEGAHTVRAGYMWSTCQNIRVFRRQVRQKYPLLLRLTLKPKPRGKKAARCAQSAACETQHTKPPETNARKHDYADAKIVEMDLCKIVRREE